MDNLWLYDLYDNQGKNCDENIGQKGLVAEKNTWFLCFSWISYWNQIEILLSRTFVSKSRARVRLVLKSCGCFLVTWFPKVQWFPGSILISTVLEMALPTTYGKKTWFSMATYKQTRGYLFRKSCSATGLHLRLLCCVEVVLFSCTKLHQQDYIGVVLQVRVAFK